MVLRIAIISILITVSSGRNAMPDETDDNFQNECLEAHNTYRSWHNTPPLRIDQNIVEYAKARCYRVSQQEYLNAGHSGLRRGFGENLSWGGSSVRSMKTCGDAVENWYNEVKDYNYWNPGFSSRTGHFTQVIWKSTTRVGCARSFGRGNEWWETYVCCNYQTAGNVGGQFPQNVLSNRRN